MVEWPARCGECDKEIQDWSGAGLYDRRWVHKTCYTRRWNEAHGKGSALTELRPPTERSKQLEMPMLLFLLLFHFGLGTGVAGWIMIDQDQSAQVGVALLIVGIITPLVGLAGTAFNVISRRRIEAIRQELDLAGGWKPGP